MKQIKATLAWRKEFQVETLRDCFHSGKDDKLLEGEEKKQDGAGAQLTSQEFRDILLQEGATGKIVVRGYDKHGRAVVYMKPGRENTNHELNNMRHLVWNMEKAIAVTKKKGFSKIVFVIDYKGFSLFNAPPLSTSKYTLEIMQRHYPERCERFYLTNPPFIFKATWAAVKPFIDPHTKQKIVFCSGESGIAQLVKELGGDTNKLEGCAGGTNSDLKEFDVEEYFNLPMDEGFDDQVYAEAKKK